MEFVHKSVLLNETVDSLNIKPNGIYIIYVRDLHRADGSSELIRMKMPSLLRRRDSNRLLTE